jgi:hypothetical protein
LSWLLYGALQGWQWQPAVPADPEVWAPPLPHFRRLHLSNCHLLNHPMSSTTSAAMP